MALSSESLWYGNNKLSYLLWPLEVLFKRLASRRRQRLQTNAWLAPVPVVVVGNISIGGTGKTPLITALVTWAKQQGYRPGVVSRGYGGQSDVYPLTVEVDTDPAISGDEPALLRKLCDCPVVIAPDRVAAVQWLLENNDCDLIFSDDGLQHYRLGRHIEIAVVDGHRGLGNGHCLPVGPLREPPERLAEVDFCVVNGYAASTPVTTSFTMHIRAQQMVHVHTGQASDVHAWSGREVIAMAGIGNPTRFFSTLESLGIKITRSISKPDHYHFQQEDIPSGGMPVVVTAKDAVKCGGFAVDNLWYLDITAVLSDSFFSALAEKLRSLNLKRR
ncbi:tetraacyldisaccharide 4'-kinase [Pokkaliibacter sp. MBI-7]|uniref:tetraacyldisaccharide 4'-kinase n=1 Tax=Pokkaliibacter sp. MBI-7 TaxID=3040600 RepID=UPI0024480E4C|nr:tetraacyldisaccharide 4'-kinase [Pokkaliibacter sp. MBI-7]MDH2434942.1 tetraacyldisaccharide 4'-kinase [Pokkaliibacter sp. MBI-7]